MRATFSTIPQAPRTLSVVLSKPRWLWGCEMGANEAGVVGGNEAVGSMLAAELEASEEAFPDALLGMDLLRLALERSATAHDAARACVALLEAHGQGGACAEGDESWTYENGFLFADGTEAWVLETAGRRHWALERVAAGERRNISNGLSIRTAWTDCSSGIQALAKSNGWWDGASRFDWKAAVGFGGRVAVRGLEVAGREAAAAAHLAAMAADGASGRLPVEDAPAWCARAAALLRDDASGICFRSTHGFCSTGSQVSWLPPPPAGRAPTPPAGRAPTPPLASHLFTAASDPLGGTAYKRFTFADAPLDAAASASADAASNGSLALWRRWRLLALHGGLERTGGASALEQVRRELAAEEAAALQAVASGAPPADPSMTFAAAVAREAALLDSLCVV